MPAPIKRMRRKSTFWSRTKYRYDAIGQLVEAEYPGWGTERLSYDAVGNRLSRMWNDHKASYTYDSRNRLLSVLEEALGEGSDQEAGSRGQQTRYEYDAQGNLLRERSGQESISYAYDAFNRTVKAEKSDGSYIRHLYDPEGLRNGVEENGTHRRFVYDGWYMVNELDEEARVQASFVRGHELLARVDEGGNPSYYVNNIHGDVLHLTDRKGRIQNSYEYDAFGNALSMAEQIENRFRYAGEAWDSVTQQYYLRARFYNPAIARFTQEDTYRGDGLNLYAYVGNNPLTYVDPSGYMSEQKSNVYVGNKNSPYGTEGKNPPPFDRPMAGDNIGVNLRGEGMGEAATTRVGRWMSKAEYDTMVKTGKVSESYTGTTHVANPADANAFGKQAKPGSMYVEFDVPTSSLKQTNDGWASIVGPNSLQGRYAAKKGEPIPEMPSATNIKIVGEK
jgi:RHS repeat-associated protein